MLLPFRLFTFPVWVNTVSSLVEEFSVGSRACSSGRVHCLPRAHLSEESQSSSLGVSPPTSWLYNSLDFSPVPKTNKRAHTQTSSLSLDRRRNHRLAYTQTHICDSTLQVSWPSCVFTRVSFFFFSLTEPKRRQCKVLFDYAPQNEDELELKVGDIVDITEEVMLSQRAVSERSFWNAEGCVKPVRLTFHDINIGLWMPKLNLLIFEHFGKTRQPTSIVCNWFVLAGVIFQLPLFSPYKMQWMLTGYSCLWQVETRQGWAVENNAYMY